MAETDDPLLNALRDPAGTLDLDAGAWDGLLRRARGHFLLARLGYQLDDNGLLGRIPDAARGQIQDAQARADFNQHLIRVELRSVGRVLEGLGVPLILLKGGAYAAAGLPCARGRPAADLDILVPQDRLPAVEQALTAHGWESEITDSYDQRFYRAWSHQIPPLRHKERRTELDVHHTIAPPTSRAKADAGALLADTRLLGDSQARVLAPADMVLHAAVHLFNEEFLPTALRNLLDLHDLLGHFGADEGFWAQLSERARRHGLERPLYYGLRYCERLFDTPIPAHAKAQVDAFGPNPMVRAIMDILVPPAILPQDPERAGRGAGSARWLLFVRSHWLRMPPPLLARHLLVKTLRRATRSSTVAAATR